MRLVQVLGPSTEAWEAQVSQNVGFEGAAFQNCKALQRVRDAKKHISKSICSEKGCYEPGKRVSEIAAIYNDFETRIHFLSDISNGMRGNVFDVSGISCKWPKTLVLSFGDFF